MLLHTVHFDSAAPVQVPTGTLLSEAAHLAGIEISQPCGGQGRCGRCVVQVTAGSVRRRSALRITPEDIAQGYAVACQTVVEGDVSVHVPQQDTLERRLTSDRTAAEVAPPPGYNYLQEQTIRRVLLRMEPPNLDDQTDDLSRLRTALRQQAEFSHVSVSLNMLRSLSDLLRQGNWEVTCVLEIMTESDSSGIQERLVAIFPRVVFDDEPLWAAAIDIGTTTVSLWLVDLLTGEVKAQVAEYNGQIQYGEDVISRIIYSGKGSGLRDLHEKVTGTINNLIDQACKRVNAKPHEIVKAVIAGNSTMIHLLLGIPPQTIRLSPFVTSVNQPPGLHARELGLKLHPEASIDCLPGVASYVGADITAGVLSSGLDDMDALTLFLDVGTNGEMVMGNREWLVTCACSAGPAFEGAGVVHGMRATKGAIEEVWISSPKSPHPYEANYRVIGSAKPRGLCGSGLISLLAEMLITGVVDKAGNINLNLAPLNPRIRSGDHGPEYVVAWGSESENGSDVVITAVDIDNLKRAKAAIYAGYIVLAQSVGVSLDLVEQMLIGGSFGKYINVEKAVQIGLLPDLPWERFQFLGNTSVRGAYMALISQQARQKVNAIAARMTYIELSADNAFYEAFMSAMFLPHTDLATFPSVEAAMEKPQNVSSQ